MKPKVLKEKRKYYAWENSYGMCCSWKRSFVEATIGPNNCFGYSYSWIKSYLFSCSWKNNMRGYL